MKAKILRKDLINLIPDGLNFSKIKSSHLALILLFMFAAVFTAFISIETKKHNLSGNTPSEKERLKEKEEEREFIFEDNIQKDPVDNSIFSFSSLPQRNFRVFPGPNNQTETPVVIHPWNPDILFGSAIVSNHDIRGYYSGCYVSRDGGITWDGTDFLPGTFGNKIITIGDPSAVIDKNGTFIISYIAPPATSFTTEIGSSFSTNYGLTWSNTVFVSPNIVAHPDKLFSTTDINSQSNFYGRSYLAFTELSDANPGGQGIFLSYSSNNGKSWSRPGKVSGENGSQDFGCDLKTYNGKVYLTWLHSTAWLGFAVSTNGGVSFNTNPLAERMNNVGVVEFTNAYTNGLPRIDIDANGVVYVVTTEIYDDDADIILHKTDDEGLTWSKVKVNQNTDFDCRYQFQPAVRIDEYGGINVLYYDSRNTVSSDSLEMYISRSVDGGETFMDFLVSDHKFVNTPITGLFGQNKYLGSYIGITSGNNKLYPFWFDNSTGKYQAWTNLINLDSIPPQIIYHPVLNTGNLDGPYNIECKIKYGSSTLDPAEVKIFWSKDNISVTDSIDMQKVNDDFTGQIPGDGSESVYRYFVKVTDSLGLSVASPEHAPGVLHSFSGANDFIQPTVNHVSPSGYPHVLWPALINSEVFDASGVGSVSVQWYKNSESIIKSFNLNNTSGNFYSAFFNSDSSEVNSGDNIHYKIIARDNSFMHNKFTSGFFTIQITSEIPRLCEDFLNPDFPPANWDIQFTDLSFWTRSIHGSYNSNLSGSAKFNFFDAPASTRQSLLSPDFILFSGDRLFMDYAYAPRSGTDSLILEVSSNSGISFERILGMAGGENGDSLNTAPAANEAFVPDSSQWRSLVIPDLPAATNKIKFTAVSGNGGNNLYLDNLCIKNINDPDTFTVKVILEGFFDRKTLTLFNTDTLRCYLRNFYFPYNLVDSAVSQSYDQNNFESKFIFENAQTGYYYIVLKHRNSLETWSSLGITYLRGQQFNYDFTDAADKAFKSNMVGIESYHCIYSGDINQDGFINSNDLIIALNDYAQHVTGYVPSDIDGNKLVDFQDVLIVFSNSSNFISKKTPLRTGNQ